MYLGQITDPQQPAWYETLIPLALQTYRERQNIRAQTERARQGLPPLRTDQYSPPIRVQTEVGADPRMRNMLMIGGGIALVVLIGAMALRR